MEIDKLEKATDQETIDIRIQKRDELYKIQDVIAMHTNELEIICQV